jgi:hypothetical protein
MHAITSNTHEIIALVKPANKSIRNLFSPALAKQDMRQSWQALVQGLSA